MKSPLLTTTYSLLAATGLVACTRWFHPAVFAPFMPTVLLAAAIICAALFYVRNRRGI